MPAVFLARLGHDLTLKGASDFFRSAMGLLLDILTWLGIVAAGLAVAGLLLVGVLAWLLNLPIDDDGPRRGPRRC